MKDRDVKNLGTIPASKIREGDVVYVDGSRIRADKVRHIDGNTIKVIQLRGSRMRRVKLNPRKNVDLVRR
jgi:hypothetical protein